MIYRDDAGALLYGRVSDKLLAKGDFVWPNHWATIYRGCQMTSYRPIPPRAWLEHSYVGYDSQDANQVVDRRRHGQMQTLDNATKNFK